MRLQLIGSHLCPNTLYAVMKLKETSATFTFCDISASLTDLKRFLALHEHGDVYQKQREMSGRKDYLSAGQIGLPCFVFEDGYQTLSLTDALEKAGDRKSVV